MDDAVQKSLRYMVVNHTIVSPPGSRYSYLIFEIFRPMPREEGHIAFPFLSTDKGKQLVPFSELSPLPEEVQARLPQRSEYEAAEAAVTGLLRRLFAAAA